MANKRPFCLTFLINHPRKALITAMGMIQAMLALEVPIISAKRSNSGHLCTLQPAASELQDKFG